MKKSNTTLRIFQVLILLLFVFYWGITFLYCSPSNYIRIKSGKAIFIFENFFYQQWGFFAPPPQHNDRLYYIFSDTVNGRERVYEALVPIMQKKQQAAPFNSKEEAIDYILSGAITGINDEARGMVDISKVSFPDSNDMYHLMKAHKQINDLGLNYPPIKTLFNYAVTVAKKENISLDSNSVKMVITQVAMPKFKDRAKILDPKYVGKEEKVFESNFLPLKSALNSQ